MTDAKTTTQQTLIIQTVYFAEGDRAAAVELGGELYEVLTRPRNDRLAFGPGIPVIVGSSAEQVDVQAARHLLIVPVLGRASFVDGDTRDRVMTSIAAWHEALRPGHVVPVFNAPVWRNQEAKLPGTPILGRLQPDGDNSWTAVVIDVALAASRLVADAGDQPQIFVSHAKRDLASTGQLARKLHEYIRNHTTGEAFFDATDLEPGSSLRAQLADAVKRGVFVSVHGDSYASRPWCEAEMLHAKRAKVPTLAVHVLQRGELRSYPYSGNGPTVVWSVGTGVEHIVLRAFVEWLRARYFALDTRRFHDALPQLVTMPRPPELLDLAQGPLLERDAMVVMHPDPEVSRAEREVLRQARPRMRLVTPSTFYRGLELRDGASRGSCAALYRREIALSLSASPDVDSGAGFTAHHVDDVIVFLERALISAGAAVAYAGDLRRDGFDKLLAELIVTYNASGQAAADYLISYLPATKDPEVPGVVPDDLALTVRSVLRTPEYRKAALLPPPTGDVPDIEAALYLSDARRIMSENCLARVALGGQMHPRSNVAPDPRPGDHGGSSKGEIPRGYVGAYPGVVEEAWWTLKMGRPLYVAGGFGGAAGALVELLEGRTPELLQPAAFAGLEFSEYRQRATAFADSPLRAKVGAPASLEELAKAIQVWGAQLLASDASAEAWNGLTLAENHRLFRSRDRVEITQLVMHGLYRKSLASPAAGRLNIELVRGDILQVEAADAIAVAAYRNLPIGGAAAAIDRAMSSQVTAALHERRTVIPVPTSEIDADWLVLADLGELVAGDLARLPEAIEECAERVAEIVARNGFHRLAIVTFGSSVHGDLGDVVARMLAGFAGLRGACSLQWFERDRIVHGELEKLLRARSDVALSQREILDIEPVQLVAKPTVRDVVLTTRYADGAVHATILPPEGAAVAMALTTPLDTAQFDAVARPRSGAAPRDTLKDSAGEAAVLAILGTRGRDMLRQLGAHRLVVQHDSETAMLPFEMFTIGGHRFSLEHGVVRRPVLSDVPLQTPRPVRRGALQLMLVVDPGLAEAEEEARAVEQAVAASNNVNVRKLVGAAATRKAMLDALLDPTIDVFHHCGHAFYDGPGPAQSGLCCPNGERLTGEDIAAFDALPRIAFFNACRSARLRRMEPANPVPEGAGVPLESIYTRAFASYFLRGGVEAYVGTLWPVRDEAAADFAVQVYTELSRGKSLDAAMLTARAALHGDGQADWANYILYGDGSFSIVR
jgi:hypothetical protein